MPSEDPTTALGSQFAILASTSTGTALRALLFQALNKPTLYSFTPLLSTPSVSSCNAPTSDLYPVFLLVHIFSSGSYTDYLAWKSAHPTCQGLTDAGVTKLRQLTLLTMFGASGEGGRAAYGFEELGKVVGVEGEGMQKLITSCIYADLFMGRISSTATSDTFLLQKVTFARDVSLASIGGMIEKLKMVRAHVSTVAATVDATSAGLATDVDEFKALQQAAVKRVGEVEKEISKGGVRMVGGEEETGSLMSMSMMAKGSKRSKK